jgi:hypothetical protein
MMIGTKEWKKQNGESSDIVKRRNDDAGFNLNSCGGCNACHQMTRIHTMPTSSAWAGGGGEGSDIHKPCAANFFQRNLGNSYMQTIAKSGATIQRKCACGGSCASCAGKEEEFGKIQTKLTIGPANDVYEQEADRVAEQVMRIPQRLALTGEEGAKVIAPLPANFTKQGCFPAVQRQVDEENRLIAEGNLLSMKEMPERTHKPTTDLESEIRSLEGEGQPMSQSIRAFFEPRFGYDFSSVRLHTGARAAATTEALGARAYTLGSHIAFAPGEFAPEKPDGKSLLAHELTHVIQQQQGHVQTVMRACKCPDIGARDPSSGEKASLAGPFPRLVDGDWCVTSPRDSSYNCIAWSIGNTSKWIWDEVDSVYGDKNGTVSITDFDQFYSKTLGLRPVVGQTPSNPEVVLYSKGNTPTHAAAYSPHTCAGLMFESKLGKEVRIVHSVYQMEGGSVYGNINRYYVL